MYHPHTKLARLMLMYCIDGKSFQEGLLKTYQSITLSGSSLFKDES